MEDAHKQLEENGALDSLPQSIKRQLQATNTLLGGQKGGYLLRAFNLVAELLDDIVPFEDGEARTLRKTTLQRLNTLWKDGAMIPFLKYPNGLSLHLLVLLPLSAAGRKIHLDTVLSSQVDVNAQWKRSRWTPLHLAAQQGNQEVVVYLLEHGANKNKQDLHGRVPASYVKKAGYPAIFSLLEPDGFGEDSLAHKGLPARDALISGRAMEKLTLGGSDTGFWRHSPKMWHD